MKPICFYHNADLDGVCSAAIVKKFVPDCELYGINYGDDFPWDKIHLNSKTLDNRTVYMVDFSLPIEDMRRLADASNLIWIDHHKTAIAEWMERIPPARFLLKEGFAACELCWAWFAEHEGSEGTGVETITIGGETLPEAVRLLGRYDVWDHSSQEAWNGAILPFQHGIRAISNIYDPEAEIWPGLILAEGETLDIMPQIWSITETGNAIISYQTQMCENIWAAGWHAETLRFPGYKEVWSAICVNAPNELSSPLSALKRSDPKLMYALVVVYFMRSDGKWQVSFRSDREDVDCGKLAKSRGGGGHKDAAGFLCDKLPWVPTGNCSG